jgi:hypothetical protein
MRVILALAISLIASGCLETEEYDVRIFRERGEPAVVVIEESNIYSNETDPAKVKQDFDSLLNKWQGDGPLRDIANDGVFIKGRELFIRDEKIVLRQTGVIFNLDLLGPNLRVNESITLKLEDDVTLIETNGKKLDGEPSTLSWPKDAKELRFRFREKEVRAASHAQFVGMLREYLATH